MTKSIFTIALGLLMVLGSVAQSYVSYVKPEGKKEWGYINDKGEFLIDPIYRKCYKFSEDGLAPIYEKKKFSFINTKGEVLKTEVEGFKLIEVFGIGLQGYNDGMVAIRMGDHWGYLDTNGKLVIDTKYDKASVFSDGYATVKKGDDFFVINKTGVETVVTAPNVYNLKKFSEGLAPYNDPEKNNGFIGTDGKVAIAADFMAVGYFIDGLAWAKTKDKKVGFINKKGEWAIEAKFLKAHNFDPVSGLAKVKIGENWAYTTKSGEIIRIDDTLSWGNFSEGLAKGKKNEAIGFYDKDGKWVIEPQFQNVRKFVNGYAAAKKNDLWGFINTKGEWVIDAKYSAVKDMVLVK